MVFFLDTFLLWRGFYHKTPLNSSSGKNLKRRMQTRKTLPTRRLQRCVVSRGRAAAVHAPPAATAAPTRRQHWPALGAPALGAMVATGRPRRSAQPPCACTARRTDARRRTRMRARHLDGLRAYEEERRRRGRARCGLCRHSTPSHTPRVPWPMPPLASRRSTLDGPLWSTPTWASIAAVYWRMEPRVQITQLLDVSGTQITTRLNAAPSVHKQTAAPSVCTTAA